MSEKFEVSNEEEKKLSWSDRIVNWLETYFLGVLLLIVCPVVMFLCIVFFAIPWRGKEVSYTLSDNQEYIVKETVVHLLFYDDTRITFYDEIYSVDGEWYVRCNHGCNSFWEKVEIEQS